MGYQSQVSGELPTENQRLDLGRPLLEDQRHRVSWLADRQPGALPDHQWGDMYKVSAGQPRRCQVQVLAGPPTGNRKQVLAGQPRGERGLEKCQPNKGLERH